MQTSPLLRWLAPPAPGWRIGQPVIRTRAKDARLKRVFITHGKNKAFITPIKGPADFWSAGRDRFDWSANRSPSLVPDKVMNDMRTCGAAIIHIEDEMRLVDVDDAKQHVLLNQNVLIEIGAAMALYGRRFILLPEGSTAQQGGEAVLS